MATSRRRAALVTNDKFGARSPYLISPVCDFSFLVVERDAPEACLAEFEGAGAEVLTADDPS
jgi:DeoR/GlpR family transcriptional regulator of sugar metabolism